MLLYLSFLENRKAVITSFLDRVIIPGRIFDFF